jgi:hypothetical protein
MNTETTVGTDGHRYYARACEWCRTSFASRLPNAGVRVDEPAAYVRDGRETYRVHLECGREWIAVKRATIEDHARDIERIRADIDAYSEDPEPTAPMERVTAIREELLSITTESEPVDAVRAANQALAALQAITWLMRWEDPPAPIETRTPVRTESEVACTLEE